MSTNNGDNWTQVSGGLLYTFVDAIAFDNQDMPTPGLSQVDYTKVPLRQERIFNSQMCRKILSYIKIIQTHLIQQHELSLKSRTLVIPCCPDLSEMLLSESIG